MEFCRPVRDLSQLLILLRRGCDLGEREDAPPRRLLELFRILGVLVVSSSLRRRINNDLNFPPNFERLVLGCIDADFCKSILVGKLLTRFTRFTFMRLLGGKNRN